MKKQLSIVLVPLMAISLTGCTQQTERKNQVTRQRTETGLEYEIIKDGSGETPITGQKVTVHYTGWLDEHGNPGTKFDSSVDRGTPFSFNVGVGQVIAGWDEMVKKMRVGEKVRVYIPAKLGYGSRGAGRVIPANANLIFDIEMLNIS